MEDLKKFYLTAGKSFTGEKAHCQLLVCAATTTEWIPCGGSAKVCRPKAWISTRCMPCFDAFVVPAFRELISFSKIGLKEP